MNLSLFVLTIHHAPMMMMYDVTELRLRLRLRLRHYLTLLTGPTCQHICRSPGQTYRPPAHQDIWCWRDEKHDSESQAALEVAQPKAKGGGQQQQQTCWAFLHKNRAALSGSTPRTHHCMGLPPKLAFPGKDALWQQSRVITRCPCLDPGAKRCGRTP